MSPSSPSCNDTTSDKVTAVTSPLESVTVLVVSLDRPIELVTSFVSVVNSTVTSLGIVTVGSTTVLVACSSNTDASADVIGLSSGKKSEITNNQPVGK